MSGASVPFSGGQGDSPSQRFFLSEGLRIVRMSNHLTGYFVSIQKLLRTMEDLYPHHDGPGHVVYADFNLDNGLVQACINNIDRGELYSDSPYAAEKNIALRPLLAALLEIPEEARIAYSQSDACYEEWVES